MDEHGEVVEVLVARAVVEGELLLVMPLAAVKNHRVGGRRIPGGHRIDAIHGVGCRSAGDDNLFVAQRAEGAVHRGVLRTDPIGAPRGGGDAHFVEPSVKRVAGWHACADVVVAITGCRTRMGWRGTTGHTVDVEGVAGAVEYPSKMEPTPRRRHWDGTLDRGGNGPAIIARDLNHGVAPDDLAITVRRIFLNDCLSPLFYWTASRKSGRPTVKNVERPALKSGT